MMPFLEIYDFASDPETRGKAVRLLTEATVAAFAVHAEIVTIYFRHVSADAYGNADIFGFSEMPRQILVKVHALRRDLAAHRSAAALITDAVVTAYGVATARVAIYFLDRAPDEVAHGGVLVFDQTL